MTTTATITEQRIAATVTETTIAATVTETTIAATIGNAPGAQGPAGPGVPSGGTTGQVLAKASDANDDTEWIDAGSGSGNAEILAFTIGDGAASDIVVTHGYGTRDLLVTLRQNVPPYTIDPTPTIDLTSINALTVHFSVAPDPGAYRVIIAGVVTTPGGGSIGLDFSQADNSMYLGVV